MNRESSFWIRLGGWLLHRRWWLVAVGSLGIFVFEFLEYNPSLEDVSNSFFFEITFYGIILPVSTGLALTSLAKFTEIRTELAWSSYYGDLKHNLNIHLNNAHSHTELAETLLQFVKVILPLEGMELFKYEQITQIYRPILAWLLDKEVVRFIPAPQVELENCVWSVENIGVDTITLQPCTEINVDVSSKASSCYCIPFYFSNTLVAIARFYLSSGSTPTLEQTRLLKEVTPEIASAFQRIQLERLAQTGDDRSISAERQRIARDVHDALGHSLAYLQLRLDEIRMEIGGTELNNLKQELENLREVATEAYDQMRDVLIVFSPVEDSNIEAGLESLATKIKQRANFELRFQSYGKSHPLPFSVQRNIYYIIQEALTNIEKHANAKAVNVELSWEDTDLTIRIQDDGVGFEPDLQKNGHFGLRIMQERALECGARLSITSQVGQGTQLGLQVPYEDKN